MRSELTASPITSELLHCPAQIFHSPFLRSSLAVTLAASPPSRSIFTTPLIDKGAPLFHLFRVKGFSPSLRLSSTKGTLCLVAIDSLFPLS
ncbi:hypothetical protein KSP40_PGU022724 [Platanthera guangdongensis]|uniref:Uncharacterized protein n=1 Tax=Platanthera guangdongensis TaxID=2320717 RepID=A0ABR2M9N5_9ASPA